MGLEAAPEVMARIRAAGMTIVFVNTRAQAELLFQALWKLNDATLPIALHHGSLEVEQRRRVEAAMAAGQLRAVVATSSLDLGIDWGGVDQVIQVGAPKGVSPPAAAGRPRQSPDGRAEPRRAGAGQPLRGAGMRGGDAGRRGRANWTAIRRAPAGSTCWRSTCWASPAPPRSCPTTLFAEVRRAAPYAGARARGFRRRAATSSSTGGYALAAYERYRKLFRDAEGRMHVRSASGSPRQHRMNIGTIVEAPLLKVRLAAGAAGPVLGEVEEYFVNLLRPGDTFHVRRPRCCASCGCARRWWRRPRAAAASRWCPPMPAGGCR